MTNLYNVQDPDRPMFVMAESFGEAVDKWREFIARENNDDGKANPSDFDPDGVQLVAKSDEIIL